MEAGSTLNKNYFPSCAEPPNFDQKILLYGSKELFQATF
jgi:hypothetical protein